MSLIDLLAQEYLTKNFLSMDHGLKKPRPGGYSIVRDLQEDLVDEQKKQASNILETSDLYLEMIKSDGVVSATRDEIRYQFLDLVDIGPKLYREVYYSSRVTYIINIGALLDNKFRSLWSSIAMSLSQSQDALETYIEEQGADHLFDKWLPAIETDVGYQLDWDLESMSYRPDQYVDVVFQIRERHLKEEMIHA